MSPPDDKSLIEKAFDPAGPLYDGPTSKGRRKYDQTFWWVRVVKDVGFPILAAWWVATKLLPAVESLDRAVQVNTRTLTAVACSVDPDLCSKLLRGEQP